MRNIDTVIFDMDRCWMDNKIFMVIKMKYGILLRESIKDEKKGIIYETSLHDRIIFKKMLKELNKIHKTHFKYWSEIKEFHIVGSGEIIRRYIYQFEAELAHSILIHELVAEKVPDTDEVAYDLYLRYKQSKYYISDPKETCYDYGIEYDNVFRRLKSKRIEERLVDLMKNPRDAFYLPLTLQMLSRKCRDDIKVLLFRYVDSNDIEPMELGLNEEFKDDYYPPYSSILYQLRCNAVVCLKYYHDQETIDIVEKVMLDDDDNLKKLANNTLVYIKKRSGL